MALKLDDRPDELYDDNQPGWRSNLNDLEDQYNAPSTGDDDLPANHPSRSDANATPLEDRENAGDTPAATKADQSEKDKVGDAAGWKTKLSEKSGAFQAKKSASKKKIAAFLGGGVGVLFLVLIALFFLANSLKIQHLAENIAVWQFARTGRITRLSASRVTTAKIDLDSADDGRYNTLKNKYEKMRSSTWGKLDKYRPQKVVDNLRTNDVLSYKYSDPSPTGRVKLTAVIVNGEEIPVAEKRLFRPFSNSTERIRFSSDVEKALGSSLKDHKSLVRNSVLKKVRESAGVKLKWYDKLGDDYRGLPVDEADQKMLKESKEKIGGEARKSSNVPGVDDATDAGEKATQDCLDDVDCAKKIREAKGSVADVPEINNAIDNTLDSPKLSAATNILSTASTVYAVAAPVCMIYEGSIVSSQEMIDQQSDSAIATYYSVASADHQQRVGDVSAEAVGAMNRKVGNIGASQAVLQSSGVQQEPGVISAQATAIGDFTAIDAIFGNDNALADYLAEDFLDNACPALTDWRLGVALGVGETAGTIFGCVASGCVAAGAKESAKLSVRQAIGTVVRRLATKRTFARIAGESAAVASATIIAKSLVLGQMNAQYNGLASDEVMGDQTLVGGTLVAEETNRQVSFGSPLPRDALVSEIEQDKRYVAENEKAKPAFERYASLQNPNSLLSRAAISTAAAANNSRPFESVVKTMRLWLDNAATLLANTFGMSKAYAQSSDEVLNSGVVSWGWTEAEEALIDSDPSYAMLENELVLENSGKEDEINDKYGKCYSKTMGELLAGQDIVRDAAGNVIPDQGDCSPSSLGPNNGDYGDLVFRWRLKNRNVGMTDHLDQLANPVAGDDTSSGTSTPGNLPTDTVTEAETAITRTGNIRVHTSIVDNVSALVEAAAKDGLTLTGGGWRDSETQIKLRKEHCGTSQYAIYEAPSSSCSPPTARPGSSNHERGLAIDFQCNGSTIGSHSSPCFVWLAANAATYGLKNLPSEPWHWSVDGQ